jgi:AAA domain
LVDCHGVKVGPDDFLVHEGAEWSHAWRHLERVLPDDPRLKPVQAWWQRWRERQATEDALRSTELETVDITETSGLCTVSFPSYRIHFDFDRLSDAGNRVSAELTVKLGDTELLGETTIGLKSESSRDKIAKTLKGLASSFPWKRLLERACTATCKRYQVGEPIIVLDPADSVHVPYLLNPFIHQGHPSLIYAPGGSLKSYFGLYFALLASHGAQQNGLAALRVPVLYLDWELNQQTVGGRLRAFQIGHPELAQYVPFYRRCERPLHQEIAPIARHVAEHGVELLILDSAAMACGGDLNKPETVIQLTRSLRTIGCSSLLLAHVSKMTPEG